MKRSFDLVLVICLLPMVVPLILIIAILVYATSAGPILYWSNRVGKYNRYFMMPKFRTMNVDAPTIATNLLGNPEKYITPLGQFLRKSSLDELPQLWSILLGDMSFVGPRPALYNQIDLIELRTRKKIHLLVPGLTGWAQVNGRDQLTVIQKVKFDKQYCINKSLCFDIKILWITFKKVLFGDGISH